MKRKKLFKVSTSLVVLVALIILVLTSCGTKNNTNNNVQNDSTYNLQLGFAASDETTMAKVLREVVKNIETESNGKVKIDIYPNAQLGGDRELIESCQAGNVAMVAQTTAPQVAFIPTLAIFDLPNLFDNIDLAYEVLNGPFKDRIEQEYEKAGFKLLMMTPIGFREMTSNKPIERFEDFKGVKIRTMENKYHIAYWKALGANPTPLNFSELYMALQQGMVEAQENPVETVIASKFYEVQKYMINTNHIMFIATLIMNKNIYDNMPEEIRNLIEKNMKQGSERIYQLSKESYETTLKELENKGMKIIDLSPDVVEKIKEASKPVYDMIRKDVGDELVDQLMKSIEEAKKS